ncbi:MAG: secondary thiamine-phosphate synthase enzyme YjbQ [Candidatus Woesearchaeota archaeon]
MARFTITTTQSVHDITDTVASFAEGCSALVVSALHTSCGIIINEHTDGSVADDLQRVLDRLVPDREGYAHDDGNAHAHLRSILAGDRVVVPVEDGRLVLGTWQRILLVEFDGPRTRTVHVGRI